MAATRLITGAEKEMDVCIDFLLRIYARRWNQC